MSGGVMEKETVEKQCWSRQTKKGKQFIVVEVYTLRDREYIRDACTVEKNQGSSLDPVLAIYPDSPAVDDILYAIRCKSEESPIYGFVKEDLDDYVH